MPDVLDHTDISPCVLGYFSIERLTEWARLTRDCSGYHDPRITENVAKITLHPEFRELNRGLTYLIPDASEETIPGVQGAVPKDLSQDAILVAKIMAYAPVIPHGLSQVQLEEIYSHHCMEMIVRVGRSFKHHPLSVEDSAAVVREYIRRVAVGTWK